MLARVVLSNDVLNTGVTAALIGGFALGSLQEGIDPAEDTVLARATYLLSLVAVHACTCSCLSSAFLYYVANVMEDNESVAVWASRHPILLRIPILKFAAGCVCYLVSVLLLSWRHLEGGAVSRYLALGIGGGSVLMVFVTVVLIFSDMPKSRPGCGP
eukprot:SAG31_NODE_4609_length_3098_cov_2.056019_5_plen_158_part_00